MNGEGAWIDPIDFIPTYLSITPFSSSSYSSYPPRIFLSRSCVLDSGKEECWHRAFSKDWGKEGCFKEKLRMVEGLSCLGGMDMKFFAEND